MPPPSGSGSREAVVALRPDGAGLRIVVSDGGAPTAAGVPGVGLTSMRERAEQLGGEFRAGGGCVEVLLPCDRGVPDRAGAAGEDRPVSS